MSAYSPTEPVSHVDVLHPMLAALVGAGTFAATMTAGAVLHLNADAPDAPATAVGELAAYAGLVLVAVAIATWAGTHARAGSPALLTRVALGLALASAVTFVAFWSGWPHVFGAVAVVLALEHRRRVGSFGGMTVTALVIGASTYVAAAVTCLVG